MKKNIYLFLLIFQSILLPYQTDVHPYLTREAFYMLQSLYPGIELSKLFFTFSSGLHFGEGRFKVKPIIFTGVGYAIGKNFNLNLELVPVFVELKNNSYPPYIYYGEELSPGKTVTYWELFFTGEFKIFKKLGITLGFAPKEEFCTKLGINYEFVFKEHANFFMEYNLILVGRPIMTTPSFYFRTNSFAIGIKLII